MGHMQHGRLLRAAGTCAMHGCGLKTVRMAARECSLGLGVIAVASCMMYGEGPSCTVLVVYLMDTV